MSDTNPSLPPQPTKEARKAARTRAQTAIGPWAMHTYCGSADTIADQIVDAAYAVDGTRGQALVERMEYIQREIDFIAREWGGPERPIVGPHLYRLAESIRTTLAALRERKEETLDA